MKTDNLLRKLAALLMTFLFLTVLSIPILGQNNDNSLPQTGNVGVGTTTPSCKLQVAGASEFDSTAIFKDSVKIESDLMIKENVHLFGNFYYELFSATIGKYRLLHIDDNGKVDVAPNLYTSPNYALEIDGNLLVNGNLDYNVLRANRLAPIDSILALGDSTVFFNANYNRFYADLNGVFKGIGIGENTIARGNNSTAIGNQSIVDQYADDAHVMGKFVRAEGTADNSYTFGSGVNYGIPLSNPYANSFYVGFENEIAFVSRKTNNGDIRFGIGTADPITKLHVDGNVAMGKLGLNFRMGCDSTNGVIDLFSPNRLDNILISYYDPHDVHIGNPAPQGKANLKVNGKVGINTDTPLSMQDHILEIGSAGSQKAIVIRNTLDNGTENFAITGTGTVYIREMYAKTGTFPDYVFEDDYSLFSLSELELYINEHGHLPGIPTQAEVRANEDRFNVGQVVIKQLEKIEELTLYTIEQDKQIKELQGQLEQLQNIVGQLNNK